MAEANINRTGEKLSYFCYHCKERFISIQHSFINISSDETEFKCVKCKRTFASGFKIKNSDFDDNYPHRCEVCGLAFRTSTKLLYHSYRHSGDWPFKCHFCQKGFSMNYRLERHLATKTVQCSKCSARFQVTICHARVFDEFICEKCSFVSELLST
ncbi:hypothetical protein TNCV_325641 [Trichonephila clavipes]|nr:hypothetical protein TNCV_325641 [Trichonephila clavipes]